MNENRRGTVATGILLVLVGGFFLAAQFVPGLKVWALAFSDWPTWIIGFGFLFLLAALLSGVGGLAVPASIIMGIGGLLNYQNTTGDWQSWAYAWTLIIGFVGIGVFFSHVIEGRFRKAVKEGSDAIITSLIMFLIFGSFFRYIFGQPSLLGPYWPVLLILLGLWQIVKPAFRGRKATVIIRDSSDMAEEDDMDDELEEAI